MGKESAAEEAKPLAESSVTAMRHDYQPPPLADKDRRVRVASVLPVQSLSQPGVPVAAQAVGAAAPARDGHQQGLRRAVHLGSSPRGPVEVGRDEPQTAAEPSARQGRGSEGEAEHEPEPVLRDLPGEGQGAPDVLVVDDAVDERKWCCRTPSAVWGA